MIASFSFASAAHVTQWSNYLTQRAEILSRQSNLTPQRAKNTVNDLAVVSVVPNLLSSLRVHVITKPFMTLINTSTNN